MRETADGRTPRQDPNLSTAPVYKLVTDETESDMHRRCEEYKTKVVPLARDTRPLFEQLTLTCPSLHNTCAR